VLFGSPPTQQDRPSIQPDRERERFALRERERLRDFSERLRDFLLRERERRERERDLRLRDLERL